MIIYLDTCAVQRPLDELSQLQVRAEAEIILALIAAIEAGGIRLASSDVLRFEIENNPVPARRNFGRRLPLRWLCGQSSMSSPDSSLLMPSIWHQRLR